MDKNLLDHHLELTSNPTHSIDAHGLMPDPTFYTTDTPQETFEKLIGILLEPEKHENTPTS